MKFTLKSNVVDRKLVAVLGTQSSGIFLLTDKGCQFFDGRALRLPQPLPLEELLFNPNRPPVYEGDEVTITF